MTDNNGWDQHKKFVEDKLGDHGKQLSQIWGALNKVQVQIGKIEVKIAGVLIVATILSSAIATAIAKWMTP